ncbi:hypothetical protein [Aporhodopirellula aestuarii]|uniref:Uncharacterized protein n=1 Tax=Aporhodopirellula aestuarii TaxID=2950107 RepID=A0ABT0U7Z6_9BACT|nr:hypothetical protein [Aporhodopirellula aestuarii]MCM2373042.1 hypothetical protein [Aporhodopirellula aestuarii]
MTPSQKLARARNCVYAFCQEQFPEDETQLRDSIFINDGFYRGRRFRGEKVSAIWFAEEDQLKIHSLDGSCLASWDETEMEQKLQEIGPSTLPMPSRTSESTETGDQSVRRAA